MQNKTKIMQWGTLKNVWVVPPPKDPYDISVWEARASESSGKIEGHIRDILLCAQFNLRISSRIQIVINSVSNSSQLRVFTPHSPIEIHTTILTNRGALPYSPIGVIILSTVRKAAKLAVYEDIIMSVKNHHIPPTIRVEHACMCTQGDMRNILIRLS